VSGACRRLAVVWAAVMFALAVAPVEWVFGVAPVDVLIAVGWRDVVGRRRALAAGAAAAAVYGVLMEIVQLPLPYRRFDVRDMATDWAGVATGVLLVSVACRVAAARSART
jgi:hypothetical protein